MQTLVIGVDAACWPVLDRVTEEGRLPNLERLIGEGATGPLESHVPPWTPSMWPSIYTGTNPGKHGVFSFLDYDGYEWDLVNATHVKEPAIWELLDRHGVSSVVVNVPVTHPTQPFDGALVPGYMAPEEPTCHPAGLLDELRDAIGEYRIYPDGTDTRTAAIEEYRRLVRMRGDAFTYLHDRFDPEFGFVQFQQTDTLFHEYPDDWEAAVDVYEAVDDAIGEMLDRAAPDTVLLVSDHGIGEYDGHGFRVNDFLADRGYVTVRQGGEGMPSWVPIRENRLRDGEESSDESGGLTQRAVAAAANAGLTPERIGSVLASVGLRDTIARHVPDDAVRAGGKQVDFERSIAYMRTRIECGVRINLEGREPNGTVPQEDYEQIRDELIDRLEAVETPDGDPVFETVVPRGCFFHGPEADRAVDIVTVPRSFDHFLSADVLDEQFGAPGQPWNHKRTGVVVAAGEGVDADAAIEGAHVFDVAPTVMATMGVEHSDRMDGTVLPGVDAVGERTYPEYDADQRATNDPAVESRLEDLGYLNES